MIALSSVQSQCHPSRIPALGHRPSHGSQWTERSHRPWVHQRRRHCRGYVRLQPPLQSSRPQHTIHGQETTTGTPKPIYEEQHQNQGWTPDPVKKATDLATKLWAGRLPPNFTMVAVKLYGRKQMGRG